MHTLMFRFSAESSKGMLGVTGAVGHNRPNWYKMGLGHKQHSWYTNILIFRKIRQGKNRFITQGLMPESQKQTNTYIRLLSDTCIIAVFARITGSAVLHSYKPLCVGEGAGRTGAGDARTLRAVVAHRADQVLRVVRSQLAVKPEEKIINEDTVQDGMLLLLFFPMLFYL